MWLEVDNLRVLLPRFAVVLTLPIVTMIALPLFTPTLAQFRLRPDRLLRLQAYGCAGMWWIGVVLIIASVAAYAWNEYQGATATRIPLGRGWWTRDAVFFGGDVVLELLARGNVMPQRYSATAHWFSLEVAALIALFTFVWWWAFLYVGLRRYLRLDRGNAQALFFSTQVIALLVLAILLLLNPAVSETIGKMLFAH